MKIGSPSLTKKVISVSNKGLPIFCPPKDKTFWAMHPRVYLEPDNMGVATCPYCGTKFKIAS